MTPSTRVRSLRAGGIVAATFAACVCSSTRLIEAHKPPVARELGKTYYPSLGAMV